MNRFAAAILVLACAAPALAENVYNMTARDFLYGRQAPRTSVRRAPAGISRVVIQNVLNGTVQYQISFGGGSWQTMALPAQQQVVHSGRGTARARFPNSAGQVISYPLKNNSVNVFTMTGNRGLDLVYKPR